MKYLTCHFLILIASHSLFSRVPKTDSVKSPVFFDNKHT